MGIKNISKWVVIGGTLVIWVIKFLVRPFIHVPLLLKPFVGVAPNFIGSFLLPFGACWLFQRIFRLRTLDELWATCWFGLMLVVVNEYLQLIPFFGRTFDYLDIAFSVIGTGLGYLVFSRIMIRSTITAN